jgi:hypothetical protein
LQFFKYSSFFNQINNDLYVIESANKRITKFFKTPKAKEQGRKNEEEEEDICDILFQCYGRKNLNLLYFQTPYLSHF